VKGKGRFVLHQAFSFAVLMTSSRDVLNQFFHHDSHVFSLGSYALVYAVSGFFAGCWTWADREGKYKDAQLNGRLQKPFDDRIRPC